MARLIQPASPRDAFLMIGAGLLGALSFPPVGLWPLAIVSVCLCLRLLQDKRPGAAFPLGLLYGVVYALGTMYWFFGIFNLLAVSLIGLAAFYFGLLAALVGMTRGYNVYVRALLVGIFAAGVEWLRGDARYLRFPWYTLPHALAQAPMMIAPVRWLGASGFTIVLWAIAAAGAFAHYRLWGLFALVPACAFLLPNVLPPTYKALLVQGESTDDIEKVLAESPSEPVQLAVLPEYAYHTSFESALQSKTGPTALARKCACPVVFGAKADITDTAYRNVAVVIDSSGQVLGTFTKQRPVPLFRDGTAGTQRPVFPIAESRQPPAVLGVAICYDFDAPEISGSLVRSGATVLVAPTFDALSWGRTQHAHHELLARLRAVENDRWILRTSSSGRTEAINPHGEPSGAGVEIGPPGSVVVDFGHCDDVPWGGQAYILGPAATAGAGVFVGVFFLSQLRSRWAVRRVDKARLLGRDKVQDCAPAVQAPDEVRADNGVGQTE